MIKYKDMGRMLGWKFSHQAGMSTKDGVITSFPGGIPSDAAISGWIQEYEMQLPLFQWEEAMRVSDAIMSRMDEDHITAVGPLKYPQAVQNKYNQKRALRANKP